MGGRNQTSGRTCNRPASGIPAKGARVCGSHGRGAGRAMTAEGAARGRERAWTMSPEDRAARAAYRQAEADKAFDTLVSLRDGAEHEMTSHAAAVAILNRAEGAPLAKQEHTGRDGTPLGYVLIGAPEAKDAAAWTQEHAPPTDG